MRMTLKQLKALDVESVSGKKLGKVHDLVLDIDSQSIAQYDVKSAMIGGKAYLVGRDQIVRFEKTKLIVDDSAALHEGRDENRNTINVTPEPVIMRGEEGSNP